MNDHDKIRKAMIALRQSYELLAELLPKEKGAEVKPVLDNDETVNKIRQIVTDVFSVDPLIKSRKEDVVITRHAYRFLLRFITNKTYKSIGVLTNDIDHHGVINSVNICKQMMENYPWYMRLMHECKKRLKTEIELAEKEKGINF
jgi:chromosomal replication initiation ATPase DnaA